MGVMPPWLIEKDVGIQDFKDDISLREAEIELIATWVDNGAPRGNPADMPPARVFAAADEWEFGEPDSRTGAHRSDRRPVRVSRGVQRG